MSAELYLIAPMDADVAAFPALLSRVLARTPVSVLLLLRGERRTADYHALVAAVLPVAQPSGCAVLIEGDPAEVHSLGADGLHVSGPVATAKAAVAAMKPALIVGAGGIRTRHEAMEKGDLAVDYVMFGPLSGHTDDAARDLGAWWAETMTVPSVLSDPQAGLDQLASSGCEFVAVADAVWNADDPAEAAAKAAAALETQP